jgi:hypothetical protein
VFLRAWASIASETSDAGKEEDRVDGETTEGLSRDAKGAQNQVGSALGCYQGCGEQDDPFPEAVVHVCFRDHLYIRQMREAIWLRSIPKSQQIPVVKPPGKCQDDYG